MIKVKEVKSGIMPYGPGYGNGMLAVYFEEDGLQTIDSLVGHLDPEKDIYAIRDIFANVAKDLYETIKFKVRENKLDEQWETCMVNYKLMYLGLIGRVLVSDDYFYPLGMLIELISDEALKKQRLIHDSGQKIELNPPKFAMVTDPVCSYITKNPFDFANFAIVNLKVKEGSKKISDKNIGEFFHINSLNNVNNHPFGCFVFRPSSDADIELFEKYYKTKYTFRHPTSVFIVPAKNTKALAEKCIRYAYENGYRYNMPATGDLVLDF